MTKVETSYQELLKLLREAAVLNSCASLLGWDEQTYLPQAGSAHRAEQLALLAGLTHERSTSPRIGELLTELEQCGSLGDADSALAVNVREARHSYDRNTKLPRALVEELSRTTTLAQSAWVSARKKSSFAEFQPWLEKMVGLKREQAEALGYSGGVPYDALILIMASRNGGGCPKFKRDAGRLADWSVWDQCCGRDQPLLLPGDR